MRQSNPNNHSASGNAEVFQISTTEAEILNALPDA